MKSAAIQHLKNKLALKENIYGLWVTLESPSITEMAVALGLDFVVVDAEHGHLDWGDIVGHIRAAVRSNLVVIVRVAEIQEGLIKRTLDIGADGIIVPHVETVEQLRKAMSYARFPLKGERGIGAERATCWGQNFIDHVREADEILVIPLIESVNGAKNIKALTEVEGPEIFFFGPADHAASAGFAGQWDVPVVNEQIKYAREHVLAAGKSCGILAPAVATIQQKNSEGFRMFAIGFDAGLIIKGIQQVLGGLNIERKLTTDLTPAEPSKQEQPGHPPKGFEPDRAEGVYEMGDGKALTLSPGVQCEVLVGEHTNAKNLFTAIVTFEPGETTLPTHTHSHAESITLLSGRAAIEVENRRYILEPFDNVTIPKNLVHCVKNLSFSQTAVLHTAMPVTTVDRTWINEMRQDLIYVPDDLDGHIGPERVTRFKSARRYPSGPNTSFIDYFNEALMPGIGMSGGYALFYPGGRLPAHLHDFDESICIVQGTAKCMVEGRSYMMSDLATAMQPRGRVHYFINISEEEMAMVWVYAGPMPERVEVADEYATTGITRK